MNSAYLLKQKIKEKASSMSLEYIGICALPFSPDLKHILQQSGPVPLCPDDTNMRLNAEALLPGVRCAIVILFPYGPPAAKSNIAAYAQLADYHIISRRYLSILEKFLSSLCPAASFYAAADTSPLCDRWMAYAAGLGFLGKNHCLINSKYGSWITIGTLLTTLDLPPDHPVSQQCGNCSACLKACPGQALKDGGPMQFTKCKSWLTQKKGILSEAETGLIQRTPLIFGCDVCQQVCPWNQSAAPSPLPEYKNGRIQNLARQDFELLSNKNFRIKFGNYPFSWRGKNILLRNLDLQTQKDKKSSDQPMD
jgi:epoxyqueuosine reductase